MSGIERPPYSYNRGQHVRWLRLTRKKMDVLTNKKSELLGGGKSRSHPQLPVADSPDKPQAQVPKEASRVPSGAKECMKQYEKCVSPQIANKLLCTDAVVDSSEASDADRRSSLPMTNSTNKLDKGPCKNRSGDPPSSMHEPVSREPQLLNYSKWCSNLVPMVLRSRTFLIAIPSNCSMSSLMILHRLSFPYLQGIVM